MNMDSNIANARISRIHKQLLEAEKTAQMYSAIEVARCPLCGGSLKAETHYSERFHTVYISASIRCSKCSVFGAEVEIKDELSCHCKGYNKLTALERVWSKICNYIK